MCENGQIKITPEMIEAGVAEFCEYDPDQGPMTVRDAVRGIYLAMRRAADTKSR